MIITLQCSCGLSAEEKFFEWIFEFLCEIVNMKYKKSVVLTNDALQLLLVYVLDSMKLDLDQPKGLYVNGSSKTMHWFD